jgi:ParB family chromosome partitioning protein
MLKSGLLEMGHARALLGLAEDDQIEAAKSVANKSLSVRETEKLVQRMNITQEKARFFDINPEFQKKATLWKEEMSTRISSKVDINFNSDGKGRVVIHFETVDEANWLIEHMNISRKETVNEE